MAFLPLPTLGSHPKDGGFHSNASTVNLTAFLYISDWHYDSGWQI